MVINEKFLNSYGAEIRRYDTGDMIFKDGTMPLYYYQIVEGTVKLSNYNKDGKELIQKMVSEGESLGESLLFINRAYPMDAVALEPTTVIRLCKVNFFSMLNVYPELYLELCQG